MAAIVWPKVEKRSLKSMWSGGWGRWGVSMMPSVRRELRSSRLSMRRRLLVKRRAFSLRISWNRCARSCARSALEESVAALMESWMLSAHLRGRRGS